MKQYFVILGLVVVFTLNLAASKANKNRYAANIAGELPVKSVEFENEGLAGTFSGICGHKLFVGGGTNYSKGKPWEGGAKIFHDKLFVFDILKDSLIYTENLFTLPYPVAYGASVSLHDGILCIGGNDSEICFSNVFLLQWDEKYRQIGFYDFPDLPLPLSYTSAVIIDDIVYVVGGSSSVDGVDTGNHFFKLDLSNRNSSNFSWETLPPFPGNGRIFSVVAGQSNGTQSCVYMFSGRNVNAGKEIFVYRDGLIYNPVSNDWKVIAEHGTSDFPVMGGTAFSNKKNEIVIIGGSSGECLLKEQQQRSRFREIIKNRDTVAISLYKAERLRYYFDHTGFSNDILIYDTVGDTISKGGVFDTSCPILTTAIPYKDGAIMAGGEIKPGLRTSDIFLIKPTYNQFQILLMNTKMPIFFLFVLGIVGVLFMLLRNRWQLKFKR